MKTEHILNEESPHDAEASKPKKGNFKRCTILAIAVCFFMLTLLLVLLFSVKNVWFHLPEKQVYDVEYKFFSNGEKTTVRMEIDPRNKIETFRMENGTDEAVEIHDFKNGITGIFFTGLQKCFIKTQIKEIPDNADTELVELEEGEISTVYEESMVWIPGKKPIDDTEFMKNSKILEVCKDVSIHWMYPTPLTAPEFQDFEDGKQDGVILEKTSNSNKRQARDLTDEDLPINDYSEAGLQFHSMWDHRGFCCHHCRRGQRYCQRVCEPLLGFYPYPYCYGSGRVICRIIMPCNWWIARMLGRV